MIGWATLTNQQSMNRLNLAGFFNSLPVWLPKFKINILWLGLIGNLFVFITGYLARIIFTPGYRADNSLTIYHDRSSHQE
jgi:hypothetical protein